MPPKEGFDFLHNISPGKHYYQFYKNPDDFFQVMIPFFQAGLDRGDACLWLVSEAIGLQRTFQTARMQIRGFKDAISSGQLEILSGERWYLNNGIFDESQAILNAQTYLEKIKKAGFECLRGAGDAACIPRPEWGKVDLYERKMDGWIKSQPIIGLCAYPLCNVPPARQKTYSNPTKMC